MLVPILFWVVFILVGACLALMGIFGARSISHGKISPLTASIVALPILLMVVLALVMDDWTLAGLWTAFIMGAIAAGGLLYTGTRNVFG